jgi:hypothetical protein
MKNAFAGVLAKEKMRKAPTRDEAGFSNPCLPRHSFSTILLMWLFFLFLNERP